MVGRKAAEAALTSGKTDGSVAIQRVSSDPYQAGYQVIELAAVAGKTRTLDRKYIVDDNTISDAYKEYLSPLVGKLPVVESIRISRV